MVLNVKAEGQNSAAAAIGAFIAELDQSIAAVESKANELKASWEASAQVAYTESQKIWSDASKNIKQALTTFQSATSFSAERTVEGESAAAKVVAV